MVKQRDENNHGSAAMNEKSQHEISAKGSGSATDEKHNSPQNRNQATEAGRKGGDASYGGGHKGSQQ